LALAHPRGGVYTFSMKHSKIPAFAIAAIFVAIFSSVGRTADAPSDNAAGLSGSVQDLKDASQGGAKDRQPAPTPAPISSEQVQFWDKLKDGSFDSVCKNAQIKLSQNAVIADVVGIGGGLKRYIRSFPSRQLALIDEINVKLNANYGHEVLNIPDVGAFSLGITGGVEGKSMVVRPLESDKYCSQLKTLVKLYDVKTVLPVTAKRISAMAVGEIWKLPVVVRYGVSAGIGATVPEILTISFGASETKERRPSVSLYRIDENNLRLRLRLDHITVKSVGVSARSIDIPAGDIGLLSGEDAISKLANKTLASQINKYIAFSLAYSHVRVRGQKLLLEFYINPKDPEQVEKTAEFLAGNIATLRKFIKMGLKFDSFSEEMDARSGVGNIGQVADDVGATIGAGSAFAGSDHYSGRSNNFNVTIPVLHSQQNSWASNHHRYQSLNEDGRTIHVQQESRVSNGQSFNVPFVGAMMKYDSQKHIYVVNKETTDGKVSRPSLIYQQHEGFVRSVDSSARDMIDQANNVLKYAGVKGNGTTGENLIPSADIFPPVPYDESLSADGDFPSGQSKTYKAAMMSFRLLFNEKAVQDIVFAAPQLILKAYINVMRERVGQVLDKVKDLFSINEKGKVSYDYDAASARLEPEFPVEGATNPLDIVRNVAYSAARFIERITAVRNESNWKDQSEKLSKVASGSEMKYDDFLKVVIQMVDTRDISSEIYVHTDKKIKGEPDVSQNYNIFNNRADGFDRSYDDVTKMQQRFAEPTELTD